MEVATTSFKPSPTCEEVFGQHDWYNMLKPHWGTINNLSFNLAFRITMRHQVDKAIMHSKQKGNSHYRVWLSEAILLLTTRPLGTPTVCALTKLKDRDYLALCDLQRNLKNHLSLAYIGEIQAFWDYQVWYQDQVSNGQATVTMEFNWPSQTDYIAPPGLSLVSFNVRFLYMVCNKIFSLILE